jgi:hypothetical protein
MKLPGFFENSRKLDDFLGLNLQIGLNFTDPGGILKFLITLPVSSFL